ncbi:penicillin-binding transpeptidase domain-containing protein [Proteinivorax tanatarense]|uniref:Penicillin-binding transpeptidase domain-containing protein n=1 Tax=Proteinivorax tanatarense TaxID=1260629 RepID=A0AAU7VID7_9FIRM
MAEVKSSRINGIMLGSCIIVAILIIRLAFLQVIQAEELSARADRNSQRFIYEPAPRGLILTADGEVVANSKPSYDVRINFINPEEQDKAFDFLSNFFDWDDDTEKRNRERLDTHKRFHEPVELEGARNIQDQETLFALEEEIWKYPAIEIVANPERNYPQVDMFPQLLGGIKSDGLPRGIELDEETQTFTNSKNTLEAYWNDDLTGEKGYTLWEVDGNSRPINVVERQEAIPGNNLVLTIDSELQKNTQKALEEVIIKEQEYQLNDNNNYGVMRNGAAVVMDVKTGEVLSIASYPTFDANRLNREYNQLTMEFRELDEELNKKGTGGAPTTNWEVFRPLRWNRGIGSTAKMLTSIAGLEEGVITPSTTYLDRGVYNPQDEPGRPSISNFNNRAFGRVNLYEAMTVSSNAYFLWVTEQLAGNFRDQMEILGHYSSLMGLGEGSDLIGVRDEPGTVFDPNNQSALSFTIGAHSTTRFNLMEMANYIAMIANEGVQYRPRLVQKITDTEGNVLEEFEKEVLREVSEDEISTDTFQAIKESMKGVTKYGYHGNRNGTSAAFFHHMDIDVAGKTGTSHVGTAYSHAWWTGFAPYDDPEIAVIVMLEHGRSSTNASQVASMIIEDYFFGDEEDLEDLDRDENDED